MVTKNQIKLIKGLHQKKTRELENLFIAEGEKTINELIHSNFELVYLFTTETLFPTISKSKVIAISTPELQKISALASANNCLAVFKIPFPKAVIEKGLILALDNIRDPGNLGTIIRLCDWFGIDQIICSTESVDVYNPKVIQATMGSISRVQINYLDLHDFLKQTKLPVFGTFMDGVNIYSTNLPKDGIIVMGNEANGISEAIENVISVRLAIPRFGNLQQTESLNVATATAIILSEFKRI